MSGTGRNISQDFSLYALDPRSGYVTSFRGADLSDLRKEIADKKVKNLYLSLPLNIFSFRILRLPFSDKKRLNEVIPFELKDLIMEDVDDIVFDSVCLGRDGERFNILVVYTEKDRLASILSPLSNSGIDPAIAGSVELGCLIRETSDPVLITERLIDYLNSDGMKINLEEKMNHIKEELESPTLNLRTGPFELRGDTVRLSRVFRVMTFLLVMIAITINLDLSLRIARDRKDIDLIKKEIRRSYSELFPSEKKITDENYQLKAHLKESKQKRDLMGSVRVLEFLLKLSHLRTGGIVFHEIGLSTEGLSLKGEAVSMDEINKLKSGLSGIVEEINASELKPSLSGRLGFTISGRIRR